MTAREALQNAPTWRMPADEVWALVDAAEAEAAEMLHEMTPEPVQAGTVAICYRCGCPTGRCSLPVLKAGEVCEGCYQYGHVEDRREG